MNYLKKVRDEINSLNETIRDKELFSSKQFSDYLKTMLKTALGDSARRNVELVVGYNIKQEAGFTDGSLVFVNADSSLVRLGKTRQDKYYIILGILIHEVGHRLYTDFPAMKKFLDSWNSMKPTPVDDPRWDFMVDDLKTYPNLQKVYLGILKYVQNAVEDGYIEQQLFKRFSGVFALGLHKVNRAIFSQGKCLSDAFDEILLCEDKDEADMKFVGLLCSSILRYMKEYPENKGEWMDPDKDLLYKKYDQFMVRVMPYLDDLKHQKNSTVKFDEINAIMIELYDYFPGTTQDDEKEESSSSGEGESAPSSETEGSSDGTGSGSGSDTDNSKESGRRVKDLSDSMADSAESMPMPSVTPEGDTKPVDEDEDSIESAEEKKERTKELSEDSDTLEREFDSAMKEIVEDIAEANVEEEHKSDLDKEAAEIFRKVKPSHLPENWRYNMRRKSSRDVESCDIETYNLIMSEMRKYADATKRKLNAVLTKRAEIGSSKGYQIGRFDPTQYPRAALAGDGKTFRQNRLPNGNPSIAFGILIDESGSMWGEKTETARKTAILLSDILCGVKVHHIIAGHTADCGYSHTCDMKLYHDFDEVDGNDKYRLAGITDECGNRDGAAIAYMCEKLLKRPEADKVLIVISDGQPTECGFFSVNAKEDTMITLQKYRKKGVNIIGAVIDDYDSVEEIYGRMNCLNLTDLTKLPTALSALVKRYILK